MLFLKFSQLLAGDVIIEVENVTVEDESHQMIVGRLKNAGLTVRLVCRFHPVHLKLTRSTSL